MITIEELNKQVRWIQIGLGLLYIIVAFKLM